MVGGLTYSTEPGGSRDAGEKAREGALWSHLCGGSLSPQAWKLGYFPQCAKRACLNVEL